MKIGDERLWASIADMPASLICLWLAFPLRASNLRVSKSIHEKGGRGPLSIRLDWTGYTRIHKSACTQLTDRMTCLELIHRQIINRGWQSLGRLVDALGFAQGISLAPYRIYAHPASTGKFQLAPQFADEDIDDLWLRLVHAAIKMAE